MAKIYTYGSSPTCSSYSLFNEWNPPEPFSNSEFGIVDPDPIELFEDLNEWPSSIFSDIKKIQSDTSASASSCGDAGGLCLDLFEPELKPEIRNIDCMWSGQQLSPAFGATTPAAGGSSSSLTDGGGVASATAAVPLSSVIGNAQNISNNKQQQQQRHGAQFVGKATAMASDVKLECNDSDFEQQLQQHSIPNNRNAQQQQQQQQQAQSLQHIKPGMSLLRKSNVQQQQQQQKRQLQQQQKLSAIKIPAKTTNEFLRERDQMLSAASMGGGAKSVAFGRPDTPLSLDDDPITSEFKHSVDLRACVMGSNNISLVGGGGGSANATAPPSSSASDRNHIIQHLSQQLQDTSKSSIDLPSLLPEAPCDSRLLTDLLDVIVKDDPSHSSSASSSHSHSNSNASRIGRGGATTAMLLNSRSFESDEDEDDDEEEEEEEEDDGYYEEDDVGSSCGSASSTSQLDFQLSPSSASSSSPSLNRSHSSAATSASAATSPTSSTGTGGGHGHGHQTSYPMMLHSDHSYTRCNDDLGPNLETPSDSDEEIDVVSIGDKKLPTNPSDKDRRALQTKVAHKFSNAHIVKTANGVRTIPPRRRVTVELPYTPASSSPVKSVANSRYPSPSATPYQNQYTSKYVQQQSQHMMTMLGEHHGGERQRKRVLPSPAGGYVEYLPPGKKHRVSKKQKQLHGHGHGHGYGHGHGHGGEIVKRHYSLDEAADTIEKRNLHNDMERQRRIGLKNLFEALKKQIPSIRDKERAPKVNILREAAKLCEALTREDHQLCEQKALLKEQLRRRQELLARLRASAVPRD